MIETRENFKKLRVFEIVMFAQRTSLRKRLLDVEGLMKCGNITADILTTLLVLCITIYVVSPTTSKLDSTYNYVTNKYS